MPPPLEPPQDVPTATGSEPKDLIEGIVIRRLDPREDKRGEIVELYRPAWEVHPDPLVFSYMVTVRPGAIRGWAMHKFQDDRITMISGVLRWVFYDNRPESRTYRKLNVLTFSDRNRVLFVIPKYVIHATQNIGTTEAVFVNFPTRPYDHANPDKYRIAHDSGLIPFSFDDPPGW